MCGQHRSNDPQSTLERGLCLLDHCVLQPNGLSFNELKEI